MIIDGLHIQFFFVQRHSVVEQLHAIDLVYFDITAKFQKPIEPETIILHGFWTDVPLVLEVVHIFF